MLSQWTLNGLARSMGRAPTDDELSTLLQIESALFFRLRDALAEKRIWAWLESGPRPPIVLKEHVRFSLHLGPWRADLGFSGFALLFASTTFSDGDDVMDDLCDEIGRTFPVGEAINAGAATVKIMGCEQRSGRAHLEAKWRGQALNVSFREAKPS